MSRLEIVTPATAEGQTKERYAAVTKSMGRVPNLMQALGVSTAALGGYLSLHEALAHGVLNARDRERIALAVAQINRCD